MLVKAKIEFHLRSPSLNDLASGLSPFINVLRGSGSGRIGSICTWPCIQQDWKLASPPRGLLEAGDSPVQCSALQLVHLISILPRLLPLHLPFWQLKANGSRGRACCTSGAGARGTSASLIAGTTALLSLASLAAVYICISSLVSIYIPSSIGTGICYNSPNMIYRSAVAYLVHTDQNPLSAKFCHIVCIS